MTSSPLTERYTGFGLQFSHADFTGLTEVPLFVAEQGVGRGTEPVTSVMNEHFHGAGGDQFSTYAPASVWTGNQGRAGYCRNTEYTTWGNGDGNKTVTWRTVATEVNGGLDRKSVV